MAATERQPLTRERILTEACAMADESGLAAVSMRKLAKRLGFEAMSLYNHVANKGALHQGMLDMVVTEVDLPKDVTDWQGALRDHSIATKDMLFRHPWAVSLWVTTVPGPNRFDQMEWELTVLATAGLDGHVAHQMYHAINNHVVGYSLQASLMDFGDDVGIDLTKSLDRDRHGLCVEHIQQHLDGDAPASFELVLDLILDSVAT